MLGFLSGAPRRHQSDAVRADDDEDGNTDHRKVAKNVIFLVQSPLITPKKAKTKENSGKTQKDNEWRNEVFECNLYGVEETRECGVQGLVGERGRRHSYTSLSMKI